MALQDVLMRRLWLAMVIAAVGAGTTFLPQRADAAPSVKELRSFSDVSKGTAEADRVGDVQTAQGLLVSGYSTEADVKSGADVFVAKASNSTVDAARNNSFGQSGIERDTGRQGGTDAGWVGNVGGDDHRLDCEDSCVGTTALPEPTRPSLVIAGVILLMIVVKRRPDLALLASHRGNARLPSADFAQARAVSRLLPDYALVQGAKS